ncbi:MAG: alpha/beta hydrolase [Planctomycetota bacterium]|nr:MAG: alpha/beta hydrolase [Planctomycetota bacterium]
MSETTSPLVEAERSLRSADGVRLHVRSVAPGGAPRARLAWIHGFAEHGGRYLEHLRWFAGRGYASWIVDLRGHGRSEGRRTFVRRFADYLDDAQAFVASLEEDPASAPLFLVGHSMGGLVLVRALEERGEALSSARGAVVLSPFLGVKAKLPLWKTLAARALSRAWPTFALPTDLDHAQLSKDPAVWEAYARDPLVAKTATARWYTETVGNHPLAIALAGRVRLPVLVLHGEEDGLADPERARELVAALGSDDKEFELWPGLRHELLNEIEAEEVRERILSWLEARLEGP